MANKQKSNHRRASRATARWLALAEKAARRDSELDALVAAQLATAYAVIWAGGYIGDALDALKREDDG